jgi:transcription initiation factor TFIIF subunit alpha
MGAKRSRSDDDHGRPFKTIKTESGVRSEGGGGGGGPSSMRPIEAAVREVLRKSGKPTTKDVTKQLRKRGLLSTDADKAELKETISRIARIRKEGPVSIVVLL